MASQDIIHQLKNLTLEDIIPLNKELGRGAYGKVFTVKYLGLPCAAKEIHSLLIDGVSPEEKKAIKDGFIRECYHSSLIRHPNIVQFMGIYYAKPSDPRTDLPIMVMELMDTSLTSFIKDNQSKITMETKVSILHDVSLGLSYLHGRRPAVIHRDLSSNNVLLSKGHLVVKISDLGMAKMIRADSKQTRSRLTTAPGTLHFMPPEALDEEDPIYGTPVDIFSFAGVALHLFSEEWPTPTSQVKKDPKTKKLVALTEAERRQQYLDKMKGGAGVLKEMVDRCLENDPDDRPSIKEVAEIIESYKSIKIAGKQQPADSSDVPPPLPPRTYSAKSQLDSSDGHSSKNNNLPPPVAPRPKQRRHLVAPTEIAKQPVETPSFAEALKSGCYHIKWTSCSDLPAPLYGASVAVFGNNVYVLGQGRDEASDHQVFCYNILTNQWDKLPPTVHRHGVLQIVNEKLTIFGGTDPITREYHNKVSTYDRNTNSWYKCYPDMLHNRHMPGVITYSDYVIVMGGNSKGVVHISIEIMNCIDNHQLQWKEVSVHLPFPMCAINPTISGDYITIVGYEQSVSRYTAHYQIPVEEVISSLDQPLSTGAVTRQWKKLSSAKYWVTTTVPYSNPPVIIGGDFNDVCTSDVSLYDSSKKLWRKVDSLTSARNDVGVALLNRNTIIVIGGCSGGSDIEGAIACSLSTVEIGNIVLNQ